MTDHEIPDRLVEGDLDDVETERLQELVKNGLEDIYDRHTTVSTEKLKAVNTAKRNLEERFDVDYAECPDCGSQSWRQECGGPKECTSCGYVVHVSDSGLREEIERFWKKILGIESGEREVNI